MTLCHDWWKSRVILLIEEILHHVGCIKPCEYWEKLYNYQLVSRISSINSNDNDTTRLEYMVQRLPCFGSGWHDSCRFPDADAPAIWLSLQLHKRGEIAVDRYLEVEIPYILQEVLIVSTSFMSNSSWEHDMSRKHGGNRKMMEDVFEILSLATEIWCTLKYCHWRQNPVGTSSDARHMFSIHYVNRNSNPWFCERILGCFEGGFKSKLNQPVKQPTSHWLDFCLNFQEARHLHDTSFMVHFPAMFDQSILKPNQLADTLALETMGFP